jgi:nucleoside-diphosphate-sugar epimerase
VGNLKNLDKEFTLTNRLRTEGTEYLLAAARAVGARKFVAQSYTGWPNMREGGRINTEDDPLDRNPPPTMRRTLAAISQLEAMVAYASELSGIVLRYGSFYGPGTAIALEGAVVQMVRQRRFPIVGSGGGVWSFIHIDDAASATRLAIERGPSGIFNIVDDEPSRGGGVAAGVSARGKREAPVSSASVVRANYDWRVRSVDDDTSARLLECESEAGAGLAPPLSDLEGGISRGLDCASARRERGRRGHLSRAVFY